jgi:uncharacterized protein YciI
MTDDDAPRPERMLNRTLYVILARDAGTGDRSALLAAHLAHMVSLERDGVLFGSGPFLDGEERPSGDGLTIVRATSADEAAAIAARDPYVAAGLRTVEIRPWRLMEGTVGVRVDYSTGRFTLD